MANRHREIPGETHRFIVLHRALDFETANGIGAIENQHRDFTLGRGLHHVGHRRHVRVEACADALDVHDDGVEVLQRLGQRAPGVTIQ